MVRGLMVGISPRLRTMRPECFYYEQPAVIALPPPNYLDLDLALTVAWGRLEAEEAEVAMVNDSIAGAIMEYILLHEQSN